MGLGSVVTRAIIGGVLKGVQEAVKENARIQRFHEFRGQVGTVHTLVMQDFALPLLQQASARMTAKELQKLNELANNANYHGQFLLDHVAEVNEQHLKNYAVAVRKAAIAAMKLCQKYCIYSDIQYVTYDSRRKMIMLNGNDHYSLM